MASSSYAYSAGHPYRRCALAGCTRRVHADPRSGIAHDYCGRTHAQAALGPDLGPPRGVCHQCAYPGCNETVFFEADTGRVHDYCSKTHAIDALNRGLRHDSNCRLQGAGVPGDRCSLPECAAPRFREPNGFIHDYCGRSHARLATQRGILPAQPGDTTVDHIWRGRHGEYTVSVLTNLHPKYAGIKEQFNSAWEHPGPKPSVVRILQVRNSTAVFSRYKNYKARLPDPNERRRFHGTSLAPNCSFGIDLRQAPCDGTSCAVCSICANSFDVTKPNSARLNGFLRYGQGNYFSRVSSKANDYATYSERQCPNGRFRMIFLCKVALGNPHRTCEDGLDEQTVWHHLHYGSCHSVTGLTTAEGGKLNYPEDVVYADEAGIPSYLLVYKA